MDQSLIVAVASSAGDLEAISELLSAIPALCAEAFIIVQFIDPSRRAVSLAEVLAKRTVKVGAGFCRSPIRITSVRAPAACVGA